MFFAMYESSLHLHIDTFPVKQDVEGHVYMCMYLDSPQSMTSRKLANPQVSWSQNEKTYTLCTPILHWMMLVLEGWLFANSQNITVLLVCKFAFAFK